MASAWPPGDRFPRRRSIKLPSSDHLAPRSRCAVGRAGIVATKPAGHQRAAQSAARPSPSPPPPLSTVVVVAAAAVAEWSRETGRAAAQRDAGTRPAALPSESASRKSAFMKRNLSSIPDCGIMMMYRDAL